MGPMMDQGAAEGSVSANDRGGPPLSVAELARTWATSTQVVRRLLKDGELSGFKVGRSWRVFPVDAERYVSSRTNQGGTDGQR